MPDHTNTEEYRVRWNAHTEAITETFCHLFKSKSITDVSLATEGGIIKAHRVVLSVCSMYFRKLFTSIEESNPVIVLPNINYEHMQHLMRFMYLGEAQVKCEELKEVLNVAQILHIKGFSTDFDKNVFNPSEREASRHFLNAGFGMLPPMSHPIASHIPPMLPPGLVINPAFSLPSSLPLHNLVSLSRTMTSPSLDSGFGSTPNPFTRSVTPSALLPQFKKCLNQRKKSPRCGFRMNGCVKQNRLLTDITGHPCTAKLYSHSTPNSTGTEYEPTDLSMSTYNLPLNQNNFSSFKFKQEIKEEDEEEEPKKTTPTIANQEEEINIVDLSPKASPLRTDEEKSKTTVKRKHSESSESCSSSASHLDINTHLKDKRKCKDKNNLCDSQKSQETDQEDECSSDATTGPPRPANQSNGVPMKCDKLDDTDEDECEIPLKEGREGFWKNHMEDGILHPLLGGAVSQMPVEMQKHNLDSTLRSFYSNPGSSAAWNNSSVTPPSTTVDIPFHLRSNECTKCGRLYKTRKGLKHHIKNECGVEPRFQCSDCDWRFKQKAHLLRHMARKHTL